MSVETLRNLEQTIKSEKQDYWKLVLNQTRGKIKIRETGKEPEGLQRKDMYSRVSDMNGT